MTTRAQSFLQNATEWLFQQGVATVLLAAIVAGVWIGGPRFLSEVKQYVTESSAKHELQVTRLAESFDADQERDARVIERLLQSHGIRSGDIPDSHGFLDRPALSARPQ